jgi:hypothetical protein
MIDVRRSPICDEITTVDIPDGRGKVQVHPVPALDEVSFYVTGNDNAITVSINLSRAVLVHALAELNAAASRG